VLAFRVDFPADGEHVSGSVGQRERQPRLQVGRKTPSARSEFQERRGRRIRSSEQRRQKVRRLLEIFGRR
jgi:hypothetical protein